MRSITFYLLVSLMSFVSQNLAGQDEKQKEKIELLQRLKDKIPKQEKEALKFEIEDINKRVQENNITEVEARILKEEVAKKRALNIENRISIIDNRIALLKRNESDEMHLSEADHLSEFETFKININGKNILTASERKRDIKYDRRTYVDPVIAFGLNNAIIEGQSLEDSPYQLGGSRFFEIGWVWRTRVFKNSNALRLNYGVSFQFNGLKPKDNQYFVFNEGQAELQEFEFDLKKSKLRMDNLVFPLHFEFGPSKVRKTEDKIRYRIDNQFRIGFGGYAGFNIGTRQKLKYNRDGESVKDKLKRDYNTSDLIYGLSAYAGFDGVLLYAKYDLNPIFKDATIEQRNISLGLRFDLD